MNTRAATRASTFHKSQILLCQCVRRVINVRARVESNFGPNRHLPQKQCNSLAFAVVHGHGSLLKISLIPSFRSRLNFFIAICFSQSAQLRAALAAGSASFRALHPRVSCNAAFL